MSANPYTSLRVGFDTERTVTAPFTGVAQALGGPIANTPVIVLIDNQSTVSVQLLANDVVWKTFPAGEACVLDLRANHGFAPSYTIDQHTQFSIIGTAGTGLFSFAILFAR